MTSSPSADGGSAASVGRDGRSALSAFSPAELALLYADRIVDARPDPFLGSYRVPLSGRHVDDTVAATLVVETMLGALLSSGDVQLTEHPRKGLLFKSAAAHLRLAGRASERVSAWPAGSPEGAMVTWLAEQPGGEGWLDDALRFVTIPTTSRSPERLLCDHALGRLERVGVIVPIVRRVLHLIKVREFDVDERHRPALASIPDGEVRAALDCRLQGALAQRDTLRKAWRHAVSMRREESGGP